MGFLLIALKAREKYANVRFADDQAESLQGSGVHIGPPTVERSLAAGFREGVQKVGCAKTATL